MELHETTQWCSDGTISQDRLNWLRTMQRFTNIAIDDIRPGHSQGQFLPAHFRTLLEKHIAISMLKFELNGLSRSFSMTNMLSFIDSYVRDIPTDSRPAIVLEWFQPIGQQAADMMCYRGIHLQVQSPHIFTSVPSYP
jgi:hypothetical protein